MKPKPVTIFALILSLIAFISILNVPAQVSESLKKYSELDELILKGFESVRAGKWTDARGFFEDALKQFEKDPKPSDVLFTMFELPDEDPSEPPGSPELRQIMGYRHTVATKQSILQFLAFTTQLEGNDAEADKYLTAVYDLQNPLWGLSWRVFIPPIYKVYNVFIDKQKTKSYGRYLYQAWKLLDAADDESALSVLEEGQANAPKDPEIAGDLAGVYLTRKRPADAKKQAELSLSIDPKQPHVLINLGLAEWMLGNLDAASKAAEATITLDGELPGPHGTLCFVLLEKGDAKSARKEAETGVKLSGRHQFYRTVQAAVLEALGEKNAAENLIKDAWPDGLPSSTQLESWFFRGKSMEYVNRILGRLR